MIERSCRMSPSGAVGLLVLAALAGCRPAGAGCLPEWGKASKTLAFHLDCVDPACDEDFFKREMPFVDWTRDRRDADVDALVRSRSTAQGGTELTVCFLRNRVSRVASDTLTCILPANTSADAGRRALLKVLKAGVAPDLIGTTAEEALRISVAATPVGPASDALARDPWNAWVLGASVNCYLTGEHSYRTRTIGDDISARRVTERGKFGFGFVHTYSDQLYRLESGNFLSTSRSYSGSLKKVWSVTRHVSAGFSGSAGTSTFSNYRFYDRAGPALEYDFYPYDESAGQLVTLSYNLLAGHNRYEDATLFGKTRESLLQQKATLAVTLRQPFGTAEIVTDLAHYLGKGGMWHADVSGSVTLNMVRGLSLSISGYWSRLQDQIYLPRGDATDEEVIARKRQLATTYQYNLSVGFNYTFGSKVSNVVNPRLSALYGDI